MDTSSAFLTPAMGTEKWQQMEERLMFNINRPKEQEKEFVMTYQNQSTFRLLMSWQGTILAEALPECIAFTFLACIAWVVHKVDPTLPLWPEFTQPKSLNVHGLFGTAIFLLLVLRTGTSYRRYWQGRTDLELLAYHVRQFSTRSLSVQSPPNCILRTTESLQRLIFAFLISVRHQILEGNPDLELAEILDPDEVEAISRVPNDSRPFLCMMWLRKDLVAAQLLGIISDNVFKKLDSEIHTMTDAWMDMNALSSTPFPYPFSHAMRVLLYLWMATLPLPMTGVFPNAGVVFVAFIALMLCGVARVGEQLEHPFGEDHNDFDLVAAENMFLHASSSIRDSPPSDLLEKWKNVKLARQRGASYMEREKTL